jgi:DNA-binding transcriptional MerR regulator
MYQIDEKEITSAFSLIRPIFAMTGGITLSQLRELTGLEGSTIQNWVKRGWIATTTGKKYNEHHLARILIINLLRGSLRMEDIVKLMAYVNGDVQSQEDDIIDDSELYDRLCGVIFNLEKDGTYSQDRISEAVELQMVEYCPKFEDSEDRLRNALNIMAHAYISSDFRQRAEALIGEIEL